jgi:hypothetical protein
MTFDLAASSLAFKTSKIGFSLFAISIRSCNVYCGTHQTLFEKSPKKSNKNRIRMGKLYVKRYENFLKKQLLTKNNHR